MTKAQMLADVQAIGTEEAGEGAASAALYIAYAYAVGFGINKRATHGLPLRHLSSKVWRIPKRNTRRSCAHSRVVLKVGHTRLV